MAIAILDTNDKASAPELEKLLLAGAHLGYGKSTRHPKMQGYIFGSRNNIEIFDLERTEECLVTAEENGIMGGDEAGGKRCYCSCRAKIEFSLCE